MGNGISNERYVLSRKQKSFIENNLVYSNDVGYTSDFSANAVLREISTIDALDLIVLENN